MTAEPMTRERLASYISLRTEVDNLIERLIRMRNDEQIPALKLGGEEKRTGISKDRMANAIARRMEYEEKYLNQIEEKQREMRAIEDAIDALLDPLERDLLRLRYINGNFHRHMPWRDVATRLFGDDDESKLSTAYRIHREALEHISEVYI